MKKLFGYFIVLSASMWGQTTGPTSPDINGIPTRQFGHPSLQIPPTQASPNYVEGREFDLPGAMAFDASGNLYVADIANNRVLAFKSGSLMTGHSADLPIGQQNLQSTLPLGGASSTLTTGVNSPTGVAVDSSGNLYVADVGNNRILRFPTPFSQTTLPVQPDLVIGQKTFNSGTQANAGGNCANNTLALSSGGSEFLTGLAVDASGNLWVTDAGNNRVLMFPAANLTAGTSLPVATTVLGQNSFTACSFPNIPSGTPAQTYLGGLVQPASLAFDSSGNLYVGDSYSRVLYYTAPFISQGQSALRVLGVPPQQQQGQPNTTYPNQYSLGNGSSTVSPGVFTMGNHLFVADTLENRVVEYDIPSNWPVASTASPSPAISTVVGQTALNVGQANQNLAFPNASTLSAPYAGAFLGTQMWVADTGNNRILAYPQSSGGYNTASLVLGQINFNYNAPNLIEGREVNLTGGSLGSAASAMVIDNSTSTPHLYVADPGNNRVLCFVDARVVGATTPPALATLVIGQPDLYTSEINYPTGNAQQPTATGLNNPVGVAVDNKGNLYVADAGNGRVLRFPAPFSQNLPGETAESANLVLGQPSFTSPLIQNADANSMHTPWGVALFNGSDVNATPLAGGLAVSDPIFNRVLYFPKPSGGDFTNGQAATLVFGQSTFTGVASGSTQASLHTPLGIASDTSDNLYIADSQNNRIMVFTQAPESVFNGVTATSPIANGIDQPLGVAINSNTSELWVANSGYGQLLRFPAYTTCLIGSCAATATISTAPAYPLGLTVDGSGNVIAGDTFNHLTLFFAQAFYKTAASYSAQQPLAPGMLVILGRLGLGFDISTASAQSLPWPTTMANLNLTVSWLGGPASGILAPIFATGSGAIYFQMPGEAPTSGTVNVVVTDATTQAVLGVGQFQMAKADPGFFTFNESGSGPVLALNYSSTGTYMGVNSAANPIPRGGTIALCLTGQGQWSGAQPPDGASPPALTTPATPTLVIDGITTPVGYSGTGFGYPGLWQINATIPMGAEPNTANSVALLYLNVPSTIGGNPNSAPDGTPGPDIHPISTTIWVGN